jgi:VanZ family protein
MALIFYFSSQPDPAPEITTRVWDKALHAAAYAVLGALFYRALSGEGVRPPATAVVAVVLASTYGAADEFHQAFVPARNPELADWIVDTLGASIGAIASAAARWNIRI